jgi:predicted esterase
MQKIFIRKSAKFITKLLDKECSHVPSDMIILGGHGQGGALALYAG